MLKLAAAIKGVPVTLYERTVTGRDDFNRVQYAERPVIVENVLVGQPTSEEVLSSVNLTGRRVQYILGIPKCDCHCWEGCRVDFFGQRFRVIGQPTKGIDSLVPLAWNTKVMVERIE